MRKIFFFFKCLFCLRCTPKKVARTYTELCDYADSKEMEILPGIFISGDTYSNVMIYTYEGGRLALNWSSKSGIVFQVWKEETRKWVTVFKPRELLFRTGYWTLILRHIIKLNLKAEIDPLPLTPLGNWENHKNA